MSPTESKPGPPQLRVQVVGGPTAILEYGGLRWLTDPTLSPPGEYGGLTKLEGPALDVSSSGSTSCCSPTTITPTTSIRVGERSFARRPTSSPLAGQPKAWGGNVIAMEPWSELELESDQGETVKVTAVAAQHGFDGSDDIQGPALGFVLSVQGAEAVYVSGHNASRDVVRAIVQQTGALAIPVLNAGAVQLPKFDRAYLTLSADHAADVARLNGARVVIPLHFAGRAHFTQGAGELKAAFPGNGMPDRLRLPEPGQSAEV